MQKAKANREARIAPPAAEEPEFVDTEIAEDAQEQPDEFDVAQMDFWHHHKQIFSIYVRKE